MMGKKPNSVQETSLTFLRDMTGGLSETNLQSSTLSYAKPASEFQFNLTNIGAGGWDLLPALNGDVSGRFFLNLFFAR